VSGGTFPVQLAILRVLIEIDLSCEIYLAASGGNVATYLAHAGHWKTSSIQQVIGQLHNNMFVSKWSSFLPINFFSVYLQGSLYKNGSGCYKLLSTFLNSTLMASKEIWSGTYNLSKQSAQLFCNRAEKDTILKYTNNEIYQMSPPIYCDNDLEKISKVILASASIPGVIPAQLIDNEYYADGGVGAASPLFLLQNELYNISNDGLHIYYLSGCNLNDNNIDEKEKNLITNMETSASNLIHTMMINDRVTGIELIKRLLQRDVQFREFLVDSQTMYTWMREQHNYKYTFTEIHPLIYQTLDITTFKDSDIQRLYEDSYSNLSCRVYY
jgi:hypothetical protein